MSEAAPSGKDGGQRADALIARMKAARGYIHPEWDFALGPCLRPFRQSLDDDVDPHPVEIEDVHDLLDGSAHCIAGHLDGQHLANRGKASAMDLDGAAGAREGCANPLTCSRPRGVPTTRVGAERGGAEVVVDTTPHAAQSLNHVIAIAVRKGRVVVAGLKAMRPARELPVDDVIYKELTIAAC